jgi:hypothetical protein
MTVLLTLTIVPVQSIAAIKEKPALVASKPADTKESAEAKALTFRLNEIKTMDKSKMNSVEKKNLHKEVRTIKRKLKDISGGVYISAGTIIIILILLVILT